MNKCSFERYLRAIPTKNQFCDMSLSMGIESLEKNDPVAEVVRLAEPHYMFPLPSSGDPVAGTVRWAHRASGAGVAISPLMR